jgi:hypothetical protein
VGWGAALGYPGFRPRVGGAAVAVQMLTTPSLAGWRRLYTVANLYAATEASPDC